MIADPRQARLVLVGGGHAHLEVLRRWILRSPPSIALTLVSSASEQYYSGMVPGFLAGLVAAVQKASPPHYRPQRGFLSILNTCDGKALLHYRGLVARNRGSWLLKDWIDRRFMRRYQGLTRLGQ